MRARTIEHDGRALTIKAWAAEVGLSYAALYLRLDAGWSIERALTTPLKTRQAHTVLMHDGRVQSLDAWAREFQISRILLEVRLAKGWSLARALLVPARVAAHELRA